MGSPVSVAVAETVMQNIAEQALATYSETIPLRLRYVDDAISALCSRKQSRRITLESWCTILEETHPIIVNLLPHLTNVYATGNTRLHSQSHHAFPNGYSFYTSIKSLTEVF